MAWHIVIAGGGFGGFYAARTLERILPPQAAGADYRVRIFTPSKELPFAGHPTLGTCHAWLSANGGSAQDTIVQECAAGLVSIRRGSAGLAFAAPPLTRSGPLDDTTLNAACELLGIGREEVVDFAGHLYMAP